MNHKQPIITRASRPIPAIAWKRLIIGIAAFGAAAATILAII